MFDQGETLPLPDSWANFGRKFARGTPSRNFNWRESAHSRSAQIVNCHCVTP
eukprot:COSAG02_NODE_11576_length_1695_cov_1.783344_1_plen_51_part_10